MTTTGTLRLCATLLALCVFSINAVAQEVIPVLKTKTEDYANVTLVSQTPTHVFIIHSRGTAMIKRSNLEESALHALSGDGTNALPAVVTASDSSEPAVEVVGTTMEAKKTVAEMFNGLWPAGAPQMNIETAILAVLGVTFVLYLFVCYCSMLICKKAGTEPGLLVWLPILQLFPMLRAAGLSGWWFIGFFIPVVSIVAHILWCVRICQARGKGGLAMFFMIVPFTYPFAFLYLAFSSGGKVAETVAVPIRHQTEPLPA